mgnify:CR=1 FL=1|tara:strand:- start:335 stop:496 length:162 start_codon:yes stop_codon:yes gene_type:complete
MLTKKDPAGVLRAHKIQVALNKILRALDMGHFDVLPTEEELVDLKKIVEELIP